MSNLSLWFDYPMGPHLRNFLEIPQNLYQGHKSVFPTEDRQRAFESWLIKHLKFSEAPDFNQTIDLIEELVSMNLAKGAVALGESANSQLFREDFRSQLAMGAAYMIVGSLEYSEKCFKRAQSIIPEEIAPYTNIVALYYHQRRDDEALVWASSGLDIEPNSRKIWDIVHAIYQSRYGNDGANQMKNLAESKLSWVGEDLVCRMIDGGDPMARLIILDKYYTSGTREEDFLVEFTGALGQAEKFDRIPAILWEAEAKGLKPGWQLLIHAAQAQISLNNKTEFDVLASRAMKESGIPEEAKQQLQALMKDENLFATQMAQVNAPSITSLNIHRSHGETSN